MAETATQSTSPIEQHSSEQFPDSPSQNNKYGRHQKEQMQMQQSISNLSQQQTQYQQFQSHIASQFSLGQNPQSSLSQSQPPPPGQVQLQPPPPGLSTPQQLLTRPPEFIANKIDATPPPQFHVIQASSSSSTTSKVETPTLPKSIVTAPPNPTLQVLTQKKPPFSKKVLQPIYLLLRECL